MSEEQEVSAALATELNKTKEKLDEAIKVIRWIGNFASDAKLKELAVKTLEKIS